MSTNKLTVCLNPGYENRIKDSLIEKLKSKSKTESVIFNEGYEGFYDTIEITRKAITSMSSTTVYKYTIIIDEDNVDETCDELIEFMDTSMT